MVQWTSSGLYGRRNRIKPEWLFRRSKHKFAILPSRPVKGFASPTEPPSECLQQSRQLKKEALYLAFSESSWVTASKDT